MTIRNILTIPNYNEIVGTSLYSAIIGNIPITYVMVFKASLAKDL